jgi:gamma-glutamylaminecyclotransferase
MLIFTYGTLKKGLHNNYLLKDSKFIGEAITKNKYGLFPSVCESFPFAIKSYADVEIFGEVYEIDNNTLERLDYLEGYPTLYYRETIEVILNNKIIEATIYFKNEENNQESVNLNKPISFW